MIKTHNITGFKYLCITKRKEWEAYTGSGVYWLNHIKKYGNDISTELLFESDDYGEFVLQCLLYSELYNVSASEEFANQIPESGYESFIPGKTNFEIWWLNASEEIKKVVIEKRTKKIKDNNWTKSENHATIRKKISEAQIQHWSQFSINERREMVAHLKDEAKKFFDDRESETYKQYIESQSNKLKEYYKNAPFEVVSEKNRRSRLNSTDESRQRRKQKIRDVYATGKHDLLYERFSRERIGVNNPAAKITVWYGNRYSLKEFKKYIVDNSLSETYVNKILDDTAIQECYREYDVTKKEYEEIVCPYCNKTCKNNPTGFKRWHFKNCREFEDNNEKTL